MNDISVLRQLAAEVAEIAALPIQQQKKKLWTRNNDLTPVRPMVAIDQICWNELLCPALEHRCEDKDFRAVEWKLLETLYRWKNFPADMVVEPYVTVGKIVDFSCRFGLEAHEDIAISDPTNAVVGHRYHNQFETDADLEKIKMPVVTYHEAETMRVYEKISKVLEGVMDVRLVGTDPSYLTFWDTISMVMGVESALYAMLDRPDYIHRMLARMLKGFHLLLDQLEEQNLLCPPQGWIHCTGAFTDELPAPGYDPARPRLKDLWCFGLAQMFSTVGPDMFKEFEVDYFAPLGARFGKVYYGCCDPLDKKIAEVRQIPNVRKISMSPWADQENGARQLRGDFVFSRKPNPAFLAPDRFNEKIIRDDLVETRDICKAHGCPLEFILKDISTVHYEPQRLFRWAQIAMDVVEN